MRTVSWLPLHIQNFELGFTKKGFDAFLDHCWWNHAIELVSGIVLY